MTTIQAEDDYLSDEHAGEIVIAAQSSVMWGWSLPYVILALAKKHDNLVKTSNCEWTHRPDLSIWVCECGHTSGNVQLQAETGGWKN